MSNDSKTSIREGGAAPQTELSNSRSKEIKRLTIKAATVECESCEGSTATENARKCHVIWSHRLPDHNQIQKKPNRQ